MEEEQAKILTEEVLKAQPAPGAAAAPDESITKKIEVVQAERLAAKGKELADIESRVDKKLAELKKFVDDTQTAGRGLAGSAVTETDEEKAKKTADEEIRRMLNGTGFEKRILG